MSALKQSRDVALIVVVIVAVIFGLAELGYRIHQRYAPLNEQVRRDTFTQSQEYNEGMTRHLYELRRQYLSAPDEGSKTILSATFMHDADGYPNALPADLLSFKSTLESQQ